MNKPIINLDTLTLKSGGHDNFAEGSCLLEAVSYIAGEPWSDHPACVSPVLGAYGRRLNDRLNNEDRQKLKPFIPRLIGTAGDGQDEARGYLAADWAIRVVTPRWLDAAGLTVPAAELRALQPIVDAQTAEAAEEPARQARAEAWAARQKSRDTLRERVKAELAKRGIPAVAVAVAADVDAAVAAAVAVAVAVDAAVAVDVAVDAAVAAAVAAAVDVAVDGSDAYWKIRNAVYDAIYKKTRTAVETKFAEVIEVTNREAIELLGLMINPSANPTAS